jgi:DNA-binding protein Fis
MEIYKENIVVNMLRFIADQIENVQCVVDNTIAKTALGTVMPKMKTCDAASFLGINKNSLYKRMSDRGIKAPDGYLSWHQIQILERKL